MSGAAGEAGARALIGAVQSLSQSRSKRVVTMAGAAFLALVGLGSGQNGMSFVYIAVGLFGLCVVGAAISWLRRRSQQTISRSVVLAAGVALLVLVGAIVGVLMLFRRKKEPEPLALPSQAELEALAQAEAREAA